MPNIINKKQNGLNHEELANILQLPFNYLIVRAEHENVQWSLEINFFVEEFKKGCRNFFGLSLNEFGFPIFDLQEPYNGFLNSYLYWYLFICEDPLN